MKQVKKKIAYDAFLNLWLNARAGNMTEGHLMF